MRKRAIAERCNTETLGSTRYERGVHRRSPISKQPGNAGLQLQLRPFTNHDISLPLPMAPFKAAALSLALICTFHLVRNCDSVGRLRTSHIHALPQLADSYEVLVELYVMSRCPDAQRCEARFAKVLSNLKAIARVQTHYIASVENRTVTCKHGQAECQGNIQQLCVYKHADPRKNFDQFFAFLLCQNNQPSLIGSSELFDHCLLTVPMCDKVRQSVRTCTSTPEGMNLLLDSLAVAQKHSVQKSCTIYINGNYRCTHDGATWYNCPGGSTVSDFVSTICHAYKDITGAASPLCPLPLGGNIDTGFMPFRPL